MLKTKNSLQNQHYIQYVAHKMKINCETHVENLDK